MSSRAKDDRRVNYAEPPSEEDDRELLTSQGLAATAVGAARSPPAKRRQVSRSESRDQDEDDEGAANAATGGTPNKLLASGKRADQNRKAQRAFRQRKDKYIKDLELRSQELDIANSLIIQLKEENDRLNDIAKSFHARNEELEEQLSRYTSSGNGGNNAGSGRGRGPGSAGSRTQNTGAEGAPSQASSSGDRSSRHSGSVGVDHSGMQVPVPVPRYEAASGPTGQTQGAEGPGRGMGLPAPMDGFYGAGRRNGDAGNGSISNDPGPGQVYSQAKGLL